MEELAAATPLSPALVVAAVFGLSMIGPFRSMSENNRQANTSQVASNFRSRLNHGRVETRTACPRLAFNIFAADRFIAAISRNPALPQTANNFSLPRPC